MVLVLTVVVLQSISFSNYALTTQTTNVIQGSAPYLTFDGGRTRVTNSEGLFWISLSDGRRFTPTSRNWSYSNPIELPVIGQSFADIGMLVPTDTDSIALSSLIGTPYNYWGDDDGDGQGIDGVTATGSLNLSIADRFNNPVARNEVLDICNGKAPYRLTLSNTEGTLKTRYGVPNESRFSASSVTYYIKPKASPVICAVRPQSRYGDGLSAAVWDRVNRVFLPQSFTPSSYGLNFPTTGANNLWFVLEIAGSNQALSWAPVSHGGITATVIYSTSIHVKVALTGPVATRSQWESENPGRIDKPSLPQVFELVGRDSSGNAVVKYGFELKQWFVNRGFERYTYSSVESWCNKIGGYSVPMVKDLTNASCPEGGACLGSVGATPSSPDNSPRRHIGTGLFSEWGDMRILYYDGANFAADGYWTIDNTIQTNAKFTVSARSGSIGASLSNNKSHGLCVYPR